MDFKDIIDLRGDRIFSDIEKLADNKSNDESDISNSIILSLFQVFSTSFYQKDIIYMEKSIQELSRIAETHTIFYFPELDQYNISQIIIQSLYIPNAKYHNSLLRFFHFAFKHDQIDFINSFMRNSLFLSLIESINVFPEKEIAIRQSFEILNEISMVNKDDNENSESKELLHQLLEFPFIDLFLKLFRDNNLSQEAIISIFSIIANIAQDELSKIEMNNLLILLRQIFDDKSINFMWENAFDTLYLLIADKSTAEFVMIKEEFYVQCSRIILETNDINTIESIIYVFESYFTYTSLLFTGIEPVIGKIIQLSKQYEDLSYPTLCFMISLIRQNHLAILMNFDIFQLLKNCFQTGKYKIKKMCLKAMKILIPKLTNEQIIKIIIPFNFMEDFVQVLCAFNLHKIFNTSIGIIARLLRSKNSFQPQDIFWVQFEQSCGVEILTEIANSDDQEFAIRASWFLEKIYSLRPLSN